MMAMLADSKTGFCVAVRTRIADAVGCSPRTVSAAYKKLIKLGLLFRIFRGRAGKASEFRVLGLHLVNNEMGQTMPKTSYESVANFTL